MEILLAFIVGGVLGVAAHYLAPQRHTRGIALGPVLGALVGGAVWLAFTWAGATTLDPWIWVVSFIAPLAVAWPVLAILGRVRTAQDAEERIRLKIA